MDRASRSGRRRGSTSAARTARARSGGCCAASGSRAARDGKRIKDALERALALDPRLQDAYFGIGLYRYYADVAPAAAKMLRWLLLLPGGDKTEGLSEMLRAREHGALLRGEADYQLHVIYLWYEKQPQRALELLTRLRDRHPRNPLFPQLIAEVQDVYLHDLPASLRTWRSLLARRARAVSRLRSSPRCARGSASRRVARPPAARSTRAIEQLRAVIAAKPLAPFGAYAQAQRDLARLRARTRAVALKFDVDFDPTLDFVRCD